jgi:hypothetical protein
VVPSRLVSDSHQVSSELSPQRVQELANVKSAQIIQMRRRLLHPPPVSLQLSKLRSRVSVQGGGANESLIGL